MAKEQGSFEIGVSRHAPKIEKSGEVVDVTKQEVDMEAAKTELEERAYFLLKNLEEAPGGAIMALEPSNVTRAGQTRDLFVEKFKELLGGRSDIEMVELSESEEQSEGHLQKIKDNPERKFIITNLRPSWLIGFRKGDPQLPVVNKWKNRLGGNEDLVGKIWAARRNEIPLLHNELAGLNFDVPEAEIKPKEFKSTPEEQALRQMRWMEAMKKIGDKHFSDRPLILEGISHNLRSDFAILALLGEDISSESIDRVLGGKFRAPFERSSVVFNNDGSVRVSYRDMVKEYSAEEFESISKGIREKIQARKQEWES